MENGRGGCWGRFGATVGNGWMGLWWDDGWSSAKSEVLIRMGAMDPLDGDRLSCLVLNVAWTWTWTRSNRDWVVVIKVC